jgi:uncharacterized membrane protein YoaK (UPF0700 family)
VAAAGLRDILVVVLAFGSGVADVTTFLALGRVFSSVITGNLVILGLAAATTEPNQALRAGLAVAGYAAGTLIGLPIAGRARRASGDRIWPTSVTAALCAEVCLIVAFTAGWEGGRHSYAGQVVLLVVLSAAMGIQSAAVLRLGDMSATYMTGTLTGVLAGLVRRQRGEGRTRNVSVLVAVVAGAAIGAILIRTVPDWLPIAALLPIAIVITTASRARWAPESP